MAVTYTNRNGVLLESKWDIVSDVNLKMNEEKFDFLQYYTNNYRPIYHLEKYIYKLTQIVKKN